MKHRPSRTLGPTDMTVEEIDEALEHKGLNRAAIARNLNVSQTTVSNVARGKQTSHRIQTAIAEAVHKDVKEVFPTRYVYGPPKPGRKMTVWNRQEAY